MPIDVGRDGAYALTPAGQWNCRNSLVFMDLETDNPASPPPQRLLTPPFVVAVLLLGTAAILAGPVAARLNLTQGKKALPLKTPLSSLDPTRLHPFTLVKAQGLDPEVVEALGTDRYIAWLLEDTSVTADSPVRFANLFVTYYSGGVNLVPHTPDVCYLGSGYNPTQTHENNQAQLPSLDATVPIRVCSFVKTAIFNSDETTVVYTFYCNGRFVNTRTGVRILINDPKKTHAYFAKIEVSFPRADRKSAVEGARRLFDKVLPILVREHFPDETSSSEVNGV